MKDSFVVFLLMCKHLFSTVEGGHRAIIFSRIGGVQPDIYTEGLHFRVPWFQYPVIYDIRCEIIVFVMCQIVNSGKRELSYETSNYIYF